MSKEKKETNREFAATNPEFISACEKANIKPTPRQASKYRMGRGLAFTARRFGELSNVIREG